MPERFSVVGVASHQSADALAALANEFSCRWAAVAGPAAFDRLQSALPARCLGVYGQDALCERLTEDEIDMVLCAIVGTAGIRPVLAALRAGRDVALASKEVLVAAGDIVLAEAARQEARILPVDSEHSAILQCLDGTPERAVRRIVLTASGGAFRDREPRELEQVTWRDALRHPTWDMGRKVTIDSATLMNKGLELIEAARLFGVPEARIEVVIHPESVVHSMVEFVDGSTLAQLSPPDMCLPIQVALTYPERVTGPCTPIDFATCGRLTFRPATDEQFPALRLAREALRAGGTATAVYNAANEIAVQAFCEDRIRFPRITAIVEETLGTVPNTPADTLDAVLQADANARQTAARLVTA